MSYQWLYKIFYSDKELYKQQIKERYNSASTYRYDFVISGAPAFVNVTTELQRLLTSVYSENLKLVKIQSGLPDIALNSFARKCLVDEVKQTNELEGISSTRKEINDILDNTNCRNNRLYGIVNKYSMLMSRDALPFKTCSDIRALYNELVLDEVVSNNPENAPDGAIFRQNNVFVKNKSTGEVIHTGIMPEAKIIEYISSMLAALNSSEYDRLINIAIFHYLFGYIHPFYDGNGRMSRFISSYLIADILEPIVSYRIAYTIKNNINKYYKMFSLTNDKINSGDMTGFAMYFIGLINDALRELNSTFSEYGAKLERAKKIIYNFECDELSKQLYYVLLQNVLFGETGLTIEELSTILHKSASTVRSRLASLDSTKIRIDTRGKHYRYSADINSF